MRKFKAILIVILLFFLIYFLQANFFSWFNIGGIMPNLFVVLVLFIGLFLGDKLGTTLGIIFGIIIDANIGINIGLSSVVLGAIGILAEYFDKNFSKDSRITLILMAAGCTALYEIIKYAGIILNHGVELEILMFILTLFVEIMFNTLLIIILYPLINKLGYYLGDAFKGKKILTRYF